MLTIKSLFNGNKYIFTITITIIIYYEEKPIF